MDRITQILRDLESLTQNKNSYQAGLGRTIQTLDQIEGEIVKHLYYCKKKVQCMARK